MANYASLKTAIESVIKTNGNKEITGQILQNAIIALIESLGAEYQFAGVATPGSTGTNPGTPDYKVMYIAGVGTYPNFGGTEVEKGHIGVFAYNGSWNNIVVETGAYFDFQEYPSGDAIEFTFYDSDNTEGKTIKINKTVSGINNAPDEAISQWWAAQIQRKIQDVQGFTDNFTSLSTAEQSLGLFGIIKTGKVIDSITGVNKLIFIDDESNEYTVNTTDLPYVAPADFVSVKLQSGTASNVSINVRGDNDVLISHININEIANHPAAYTSAALALGDVPTLYRRKGMKVVYYDDTLSLWVEMLNVDDAGANWWTDVTNNWVIEGPIETEIPTNTGGQQLRVGGTKRGNLDDVLNVNVWNNQATEYATQAAARAAVPANKRKLGLEIIYLLDNVGWVKDQFIGDDLTDWGVADNWKTIGPVSVSQNTETGHTDISLGDKVIPLPSLQDIQILPILLSKYSIQDDTWYGPQNSHIVLPVIGGLKVEWTGMSTLYYALLTEYSVPQAGDTPSFLSGYIGRQSAGSSFTIPDGCNYLIINNPSNYTSLLINGKEILFKGLWYYTEEIDKHVSELTEIVNANITGKAFMKCQTQGNVAAKAVPNAQTKGLILDKNVRVLIEMYNVNTADDATLQLGGSTSAYPLYYCGKRASSTNTWEAHEIVDVRFDATNNIYYAELYSTTGKRIESLENNAVQEKDLTIVSENLANPNNIMLNTGVGNTGQVSIGTSTGWKTIWIPVVSGQKITFGGFYLGRTGYYAFYNGVAVHNVTTNLISTDVYNDPNGRTTPKTVTVPENATRLYFDIQSTSSPSEPYANLQINEGETLLDYTPYNPKIEKIKGYSLLGNGSEEYISDLIIDLPVSDGTDIQSGYAYIDNTDRTVKVKS